MDKRFPFEARFEKSGTSDNTLSPRDESRFSRSGIRGRPDQSSFSNKVECGSAFS